MSIKRLHTVITDTIKKVRKTTVINQSGGSYNDLTDKPSTFPPSSHTHDDRYYTESEIVTIINGLDSEYSALGHNHDGAYIPVQREVLQLDDSMFPYSAANTFVGIYSFYIRDNSQTLNLPDYQDMVGKFIFIHITRLDLPYTVTVQHIDSSFEIILSNVDEGKMLILTAFNNDAFAGYKRLNIY